MIAFLRTLGVGTAVIMGYLSFNVLFLIWLERKVSAHIQRRLGPMEVGFHGSLQTVADMFKLLGKQILTPVAADRTAPSSPRIITAQAIRRRL